MKVWVTVIEVVVGIFSLNVLLDATGVSETYQPLYWLSRFVAFLGRGAGHVGDWLGLLCVKVAEILSDVWQHLWPAFRKSLWYALDVVMVGGIMLLSFLKHLVKTLAEHSTVQYLISPYGILAAVLLALLFGCLFVVSRWRIKAAAALEEIEEEKQPVPSGNNGRQRAKSVTGRDRN